MKELVGEGELRVDDDNVIESRHSSSGGFSTAKPPATAHITSI